MTTMDNTRVIHEMYRIMASTHYVHLVRKLHTELLKPENDSVYECLKDAIAVSCNPRISIEFIQQSYKHAIHTYKSHMYGETMYTTRILKETNDIGALDTLPRDVRDYIVSFIRNNNTVMGRKKSIHKKIDFDT